MFGKEKSMSKQQGRMVTDCYIVAFIAILMIVFTGGAYAQYSGECWAADYYNVFKISANGEAIAIQGFSQPLSLSINPKDGSIWVADTDAVRVRKLSAAGQDLFELNSTSTPPAFTTNPGSLSVDPRDGSCWVAVFDTIYKYSADGKQLAKVEGFNEPVVAVNPLNGDCWVADSSNARVVRLSAAGGQLAEIQIPDLTQPKSISVNPKDGSCWVLDAFTRKLVRFSPGGQTALEIVVLSGSTAIMSTAVSASVDGGCWVAVMIDMMNDAVIKLDANGKQVLKVDGFQMPSGLASDPKDGGCWVANTNGGQIAKITSSGQIASNIENLTYPKVVAVAPVK